MKIVSKILMLTLAAVIILPGCSNEKTTQSGLTYNLVREGSGEIPEEGKYLVLKMTYGIEDSLLQDTEDSGPVILQKNDSIWNSGGMIHEIFGQMKEGDSVSFSVDAQTLFAKTWKQQVPPDMAPESIFNFNVGLDTVLDAEGAAAFQQQLYDEQRKKFEAEQEVQLATDISLMEEYFEENYIEPQVSESGLRYIITEKGSGQEANPLDTVSVNYTGYLLNGQVFDTSIEEVARENDLYNEGRQYVPYEVVIGRSRVIRGWHIGLDSMSVGDKATLFVPSKLGYGPTAYGPQIPANSVLIFDVEIVDNK